MPRTEINKSEKYFSLQDLPGEQISRTYDLHATLAFNVTFKEICDLENPRKPANIEGTMSAAAIAYWFLTFDTYLNTHLFMCCLQQKMDVGKYLNLSVTQKVLGMLEILQIDKSAFNDKEIIGKIHELAQFRNVLFTERYENKEMIFRKTRFSNYPLYANLDDLFETMLILLEVTERLDNIYPGTPTMPAISLSNHVIRPFNLCFREILAPCFIAASAKQHRNVLFNFDLPAFQSAEAEKILTGINECKKKSASAAATARLDNRPTMYCLNRINDFLTEYGCTEMMMQQ